MKKSAYKPAHSTFGKGTTLKAIQGKTIEWVDFGVQRKQTRSSNLNADEGMTIHFTDGSALEVVIGGNYDQIRLMDNAKLDLDLMLLFSEAPGSR